MDIKQKKESGSEAGTHRKIHKNHKSLALSSIAYPSTVKEQLLPRFLFPLWLLARKFHSRRLSLQSRTNWVNFLLYGGAVQMAQRRRKRKKSSLNSPSSSSPWSDSNVRKNFFYPFYSIVIVMNSPVSTSPRRSPSSVVVSGGWLPGRQGKVVKHPAPVAGFSMSFYWPHKLRYTIICICQCLSKQNFLLLWEWM